LDVLHHLQHFYHVILILILFKFFIFILKIDEGKIYFTGSHQCLKINKQFGEHELIGNIKSKIIDMCVAFGHIMTLSNNGEVFSWGKNTFLKKILLTNLK
jgi:alpha-tubulin suppressor-like RCC1 family protein